MWGMKRSSGIYWKVAIGLAGIAFASLVLGFFMFAAVATREPSSDARSADGIVVLTGGARRILEAGRLLRSGKGRHLLVSGVNRQTSAKSVRKLAKIDTDLFACCVTLGYVAQNTRGNAIETRDWQRSHKFQSLIVVTASYHMPRSMAELALVMPEVELIPHPVVPKQFQASPWWLHVHSARLLAREYLKFLPSAAQYAVNRILQPAESAAGRSQKQHAGTSS